MQRPEITCITIREKAVERAIQARQEGYGPDRILFMVSTSESHHRKNSGLSLADYWKMCEKYIPLAHDAGMKVCGTVSTIWGCPIEGPTEQKKAVEFTRRWLDIGADDIEHADHEGSAPPNKVYEYYSMILADIPDTTKHIAHFHVTRGWGLANVLAALDAGVTHFESTIGGIGGQPANFMDGVPVAGTGAYYYADPGITGLVSTEDLVVMMDEMGIETGLDVDRVLQVGEATRVLSQLKRLIRANYSNPPTHGGQIVTTVLCSLELRALWEAELATMRNRIKLMRAMLVERLHERMPGADFSFIIGQRGMFSYSGLTKAQVQVLREEYSIYAIDTGRICVAALNSRNVDGYVADALVQVAG